MLRYLRLFGHFVRFAASRALMFRLDFFFRVFMDALWYGQYLAYFSVILLHTDLFGGWNRDQVFVFTASVFVVDALQMTLFSNNSWQLPISINRGDLDYHLVRPVSTLFFVSLRDFAANSLLNLVMALALLVFAIARYPDPLGAGRILVFSALLLLGLFIHYCVQMAFTIPVFWLHTGNGVRDLFWSLDSCTARPAGVWTGWVRRTLVSVLPLGVVVSFPVRGLLGGVTAGLVLHMLAVAVGGFLFLLWFWRRGLRVYASASS
jgi:ABC-2 type transport system permease protein